ncbi:MAG TPA: fused MFS/spermidine synthase [Gemmatimonadales bacterium]|jgi:spermidine synthase|nr:fused MFS/spermidine synthase [Gemmatimonadales bacterium]
MADPLAERPVVAGGSEPIAVPEEPVAGLRLLHPQESSRPVGAPTPAWLPTVFCASGFSALVYQVVWQRVLFAAFGINVEAVTVVVTAFLAGLGVGSLLGGRAATGSDASLLRGFGVLETTIGVFGLASLPFFRWVGDVTLGLSSVEQGLITVLIVMVPTTLMGATLPLLVGYLVRSNGNVGRTVGTLYFVNTAGSALAAFTAVLLLLRTLGGQRSTWIAAGLNLAVGTFVLLGPWRTSRRG